MLKRYIGSEVVDESEDVRCGARLQCPRCMFCSMGRCAPTILPGAAVAMLVAAAAVIAAYATAANASVASAVAAIATAATTAATHVCSPPP
eukprot:5724500-Prymnesium_polylepis.1